MDLLARQGVSLLASVGGYDEMAAYPPTLDFPFL